MASTFETFRAFQRDCWLAIASLTVGWLLIQDVTRDGQFDANSNVVLLAVVGWFGWQMRHRLFLMRLGPHPALTPGLERSTMLACLALVGSVALGGAALCWWFGNRMPALGPSVLLAVVTLAGIHRIPAARIVKWLMQFGALAVVVLAVAEDDHLRTVSRYAEWLSDPWLQIGSLVVAALACASRKPLRHRAFLPPLMAPTWAEPPVNSVRDVLDQLRTSAAAMRVFRLGAFTVVAVATGPFVLALLLTVSGSHPGNANVVVLWLLAAVGGIVGERIVQVRLFHGFLLVQGFARSLTLASYALVATGAVVGTALSFAVGNWIPPIAPGVFIALVMIRHHRFTQLVAAFGALLMVAAVAWRGNELEQFAEFTSTLSHPWIQFAALVAAVPRVRNLRVTLAMPVLPSSRSAVTSSDFPLRQTVLENVASSARGLVYMFLFPLFLWVLNPDLPDFAFRLCALGWVSHMVISATTDSDIESRMARDWLLGVTDSRLALGRRCVAFNVLAVISWLPVGMVGVVIHATLFVQRDTLLVILLLGLIAAFAMIVLRGWTLGRLSERWQFGIELTAVIPLLASVFALDVIEYGPSDYALLVAAAVVAGAFAVEIGGRGLAKAKTLASPAG